VQQAVIAHSTDLKSGREGFGSLRVLKITIGNTGGISYLGSSCAML